MEGWRETMARRLGDFYLITPLLLLIAGCRAQAEEVPVAVGSSYTLKPNYSGDFKTFTWYFYQNKLAEMDLEPYWFRMYALQDRATMSNETRELTINRLIKSDSGDYKAEVELQNGTFVYTYIKLTVLDPVLKPTIRNFSTIELINLTCESATADVSYRWLDTNGRNVSDKKTYVGPRPEEAATFTCYVGNPVSEESVSITIAPPAPPPAGGIPAGGIVGIVFLILFLVMAFEVVRWKFPTLPCVREYNKCIRPIPYRKKGNSVTGDEEQGRKGKQQGARDGETGRQEQETLLKDKEEGNKKGVEHHGQNNAEDAVPVCAQEEPFNVTLNIPHTDRIGGLTVKKDGDRLFEVGEIQKEQLGEISLRSQALCIQENGDKSAGVTGDILLADGNTIPLEINVKGVNQVPDMKDAKEIIWKKGDVLLAKSFFPASKPFEENLVLRPGSLTINNLKAEYNGEYEICSKENSSTTFTIDVMKDDQRNVLKIGRKSAHQPSDSGAQEQHPFGNITFHPSRIANKFVWNRDGQKLVGTSDHNEGDTFQGGRLKIDWPTGDLTLQSITSADNDSYTLLTGDAAPSQTFILKVEDL